MSCSRQHFWNTNKILLLQVDYTTYAFEGGKEILVSSNHSSLDTLPLVAIDTPASDFGSRTIIHEPGKEKIFYGTVVWMGRGNLIFPDSIISPGNFETRSMEVLPTPFQMLPPNRTIPEEKLTKIWEAVKHLKIVAKYLIKGKKIGVFEYSRSVGAGDPLDWDYYLVFSD